MNRSRLVKEDVITGTSTILADNNAETFVGTIYIETDTLKAKVGTGGRYNSIPYWIDEPVELPVKASGADIITGTDDAKFLTPKSLKDASAKRTVFLSLAGGVASTTLPDSGFVTEETPTNKLNFRGTKMMQSASNQYHEFGFMLPSNYDGGVIKAKAVFYVPLAPEPSDNTIILGLQGVAVASGNLGDVAYGTAQEITVVVGDIAGKLIITDYSPDITIAGTPTPDKWIQFRCYRKGGDTFTGYIVFLGWKVRYGINNYSDE